MITRDFHGWTVDEAIDEVYSLVDAARMMETEVQVELITGHGVIQGVVMKALEAHGLNPSIKMSNSGVVIVIME